MKAMNVYINRVAAEIFSCLDSGNRPSGKEPERFYHGFVPGPGTASGACVCDAVIIEFKIQNEDEKELSHTVQAALAQIEEKTIRQISLQRALQRSGSANMDSPSVERKC